VTKIQLLAILSEAEADEHFFISYDPLCPKAAAMIKSFWEQNSDLDRAGKISQLQQESGDDYMFGRPKDEVMGEIVQIFEHYDKDANGTLDPAEFKQCLSETGLLGRPLDAKEVASVMMGIDENDDGKVDYNEFITFALEVLNYYYREQRIAQM